MIVKTSLFGVKGKPEDDGILGIGHIRSLIIIFTLNKNIIHSLNMSDVCA